MSFHAVHATTARVVQRCQSCWQLTEKKAPHVPLKSTTISAIWMKCVTPQQCSADQVDISVNSKAAERGHSQLKDSDEDQWTMRGIRKLQRQGTVLMHFVCLFYCQSQFSLDSFVLAIPLCKIGHSLYKLKHIKSLRLNWNFILILQTVCIHVTSESETISAAVEPRAQSSRALDKEQSWHSNISVTMSLCYLLTSVLGQSLKPLNVWLAILWLITSDCN